ncbi:MAG: LPXTG cell wall anchor domain-containing protein [Faecalicoccus sp.]|uniref:mucin-binding protein n=1 Tax=Faecalicoccus sp. TaxID=1971758 RepID=UPI002A7F7B4F|nr:LPXTG cell wall anchor domain-containing protein [Faecalicoccus sp.]MDY4277833.1 LPXTG cell wall anchor domain-containing protein [Faecalicoccus sp.]
MNKRKKKLYSSGLSFLTASTMLIQTVGVQAQETESSSADEANTSSLPPEDSSKVETNPDWNTEKKPEEQTLPAAEDVQPVEESPATEAVGSANAIDMTPTTNTIDHEISYTLDPAGLNWPSADNKAAQFQVSLMVKGYESFTVYLPAGLSEVNHDTPDGYKVVKSMDQNNGTLLTYTNSSPNDALITFNVSYKFGLYPYGSNGNYNNYQFAPGNTDLKVIVEAPSAHLEGTIHVNNPETMDFVADVKNNARPDNTFTADGKSIYTFTMDIVHDPARNDPIMGFGVANNPTMNGVIHVPKGFVLKGASMHNWWGNSNNIDSDEKNVPGIPTGVSQPDGPGGDIVITNIQGAGYSNYPVSHHYFYGYFEKGTPKGTYQFTPELTLSPKFLGGGEMTVPVQNRNLSTVILGQANPGVMTGKYGFVLEGYSKNDVDLEHEGFYAKSISDEYKVTGFLTGKSDKPGVNEKMPYIGVDFEDEKTNQTNTLRTYKITLPQNWCGNITDVIISTGVRGSVSQSNNEGDNGPFQITLDTGEVIEVNSIKSSNAQIDAALSNGAHIVSIEGEANILPGNNISVRLKNAVIKDGTYQSGQQVPIQIHVHSVTSDTDIDVVGHLKYFDDYAIAGTAYSIANSMNYDMSGTYTQGQLISGKYGWSGLGMETAVPEDTENKIILPESAIDRPHYVRLPVVQVRSIAHQAIDVDYSKLGDYGWTHPESKKKYYPVITDLGIDESGEHVTQFDFSMYEVNVPKNANMGSFFYPNQIPFKVSDMAVSAQGTTDWVTRVIDQNDPATHPKYGGKVYDGGKGKAWKITIPTIVGFKNGVSGEKTSLTAYYGQGAGAAGFDRGVKSDTSDDKPKGILRLAITNSTNYDYINGQAIAILPRNDSYSLVLTGPGRVETVGTLYYSTKSLDLPKANSNVRIELNSEDWMTEDQVKDWSSIRSVALNSSAIQTKVQMVAYLPIQVENINDQSIGQTAIIPTYSYAHNDDQGLGTLSNRTDLETKIYGTPQIHVYYKETKDGTTPTDVNVADPKVITGRNTDGTGASYDSFTTSPVDVEDYTYVGLAQGKEKGTLDDQTQDVVYLYKQKEYKVTVHYIDITGASPKDTWTPSDGTEVDSLKQELNGVKNETYQNEVQAPAGYQIVQQDDAAAQGTFTGEMDAYVYIKADTQKVVYTIIDDSAKKTLEDKVSFDSGPSGTNLHKTQKDFDAIIKTYTDKGYEVVSQNELPGTFDSDTSKDQEIVVHLKHATVTVTPDHPQTPGDPIDGSESNWPDGVDQVSLQKSITRTIDYVDGLTKDKVADSVTQTVTFTHHVVVDKVTGEVLGYDTNGDDTVDTTNADDAWMTDSNTWAEVTSPDLSLKGYEAPDVSKVDEKVVTSNTSDETVTVTYDRSTQKVVYTIIDDTAKKTLKDKVEFDHGLSGSKLSKKKADLDTIVKVYTNKGYEVVSQDEVPSAFDTDKSTDQVITIHLKHPTITVTPDNPQTPGGRIDGSEGIWPSEAGKEELTKTITRNIHYVDGLTRDEVADSVTQKVIFNRHVIIDKVTGAVLGYDTNRDDQVDTTDADDAWMTDSDTWAEVTSPDLSSKGYEVPDISKVDEKVVTSNISDETVTVTYNRSMQKVVYTIIDDSADTTLEDKVAFDSGASETNLHKTQNDFDAIIKTYTDKGYEVVNQGTLPTAFDTDSSKDQEVVVHLKHAIITVTPEDPKKPGQPIDGSESNWPSEAGANALSKTITRTIDYLDELTSDKIADSVNQSMTFKRHVIIDKVTGEVLGYDTNGDDMVDTTNADDAWMTDSNIWNEVISPDFSDRGFGTPSLAKVGNETVDVFMDSKQIKVLYPHTYITITPDNPQTPGEPIDGTDMNWPDGVDLDSLQKSITRTIDYVDGLTHKKVADSVTQKVTFNRHVIIDKVTGEVLGYDTNGDGTVDTTDADDTWMTDSNTWAEVTSPDLSLKGYEAPDVSKVDEKVVTSNISDETVTVTYNRSTQKVVYTIIDDTAKKTLEDNVLLDTGPSGASLNKTQEDLQKIADGYGTKGYAIVSVDTLPEHFDIDPSTDQVVIIHLEHTYETITPDNAKTPGDPIDGSESVWPKEAGKENLQKSTTRTIEYIDGMTKENVADSVEQTVEFERHVIIDKVTGEVLGYDTNDDNQVDTEDPDQAWMHTDGEWSEVVSPDLSSQGYEKPSMEKVEAENVDPSTETKTIQIVYEISNRIILPSTGGIGSLFYTISGLILTGIGWKGFRKNKKK